MKNKEKPNNQDDEIWLFIDYMSPEVYYSTYIKDSSQSEIDEHIEELKKEIADLERRIQNKEVCHCSPNYKMQLENTKKTLAFVLEKLKTQ